MISTRYANDYRMDYEKDENGRGRTKLVYVGSLYQFNTEKSNAFQKWGQAAGILALLWVVWIGCAFLEQGLMHSVFVSIPYILIGIPLLYLTSGLYHLRRSRYPFEKMHKEHSVDRFKPCCLMSIICCGIVIAGAVQRYAVMEAGVRSVWNLFFIAGMAIFIAGTVIILKISQWFTVHEIDNPNARLKQFGSMG